VPPAIELVVVDELGIRPFGPAARGRVDLVRKNAHGDRDGDTFRVEEGQLVLPVEPTSGDPRGREPGERDVVEDVVSRHGAVGRPIHEQARDGLIAQQVVIDHPRGQADG
jgi:hypothetical protein